MYEDFYRLTGKPFQLSPDPAFYFGSKGHSSAGSGHRMLRVRVASPSATPQASAIHPPGC